MHLSRLVHTSDGIRINQKWKPSLAIVCKSKNGVISEIGSAAELGLEGSEGFLFFFQFRFWFHLLLSCVNWLNGIRTTSRRISQSQSLFPVLYNHSSHGKKAVSLTVDEKLAEAILLPWLRFTLDQSVLLILSLSPTTLQSLRQTPTPLCGRPLKVVSTLRQTPQFF